MTKEEFLNEKERKALKLSADLWNAIWEMENEEKMNQQDILDHRRDINDIQARIISRGYERLSESQSNG